MKESRSKYSHRTRARIDPTSILDLLMICPKCGGEVGLWPESAETVCIFCQHQLFEKEGTIH